MREDKHFKVFFKTTQPLHSEHTAQHGSGSRSVLDEIAAATKDKQLLIHDRG